MNNYIILDGKKYRTNNKTWRFDPVTPSTERVLLSGALDATWGAASLKVWTGEIEGPVTPDDATWGTISDLRTSLLKRQKLSFTDHYGSVYQAKLTGPFTERSSSPKWDSPSNVIFVKAKVVAV